MSREYKVVILGRPNVGKSTLFNRLIGKKRSLVHNLPGVTRDRIEGRTHWGVPILVPILVIDTGGMGGDVFSDEIFSQVKTALSDADVVLFVLDSQTGVTPLDSELLRKIKKTGLLTDRPIIAVINKVDDEIHESRIHEFYQFGLPEMLTLSAEHARGIDDLKEQILAALPIPEGSKNSESSQDFDPEVEEHEQEEKDAGTLPRIAIVGRPNVGKSTLLNALLGKERVITSPIAGTTVDAIDVEVTLNDHPFLLIDTAGIRRKNKTEQGIEVLSVVQVKKTVERAQVAILVLDGEKGICDQDEKIGGLLEEAGCGIILAVNKWDTHDPNFTEKLAAERIRKQIPYLHYAPLVFISALHGKGLDDLGNLLNDVYQQRGLKIQTRELTEWVRKEATVHNPRDAKFYLCHQAGRTPPTFLCHVNDPEKIHFSLQRHLVNALRQRWGFMGSPVRFQFVEGKNRRSLPKNKGKPGRPLLISKPKPPRSATT